MSRKNNLFEQVPVQKVPRNLFDLSHEVKMSAKFGKLYPVLLMETLPGDTWRETMTAMVRFAPMLAPIMHRVDVKTDFFFVPNRLIWENWEDFITGGQNGDLTPIPPYVRATDVHGFVPDAMKKGTLWDYFGLPVAGADAVTSPEEISFLPFRAYAKIFNDYYRDPNLDTERDIHAELDGQVTGGDGQDWMFSMQNRGWERDYFTAALPWAQRGAEVLMPLSGIGTPNYSDFTRATVAPGGTVDAPIGDMKTGFGGDVQTDPGTGVESIQIQNIDYISIDEATTTINDFRRTLAIQRWMENNARGGGRYIEQIQSHFNVTVPDFRLQRAEYLGGGRQAVNISEVLSTADSVDVPVGDMAGHGISVGKSNRFTYRAQEHGFIMGIMTIIPRTAYDQGLPKLWSRKQKFDYAFPELAHLGEQEILNKEVYMALAGGEVENNDDVFGYIPRYAEYKFMQDRISGDFRDNLAFWHLARLFTSRPVLDSAFLSMQENDPGNEVTYRRIFANQDGTDYLWIQLFHKLSAKRPLPYFGVPTLKG